jgi:hypothetical protein
VHLLLNGPDEGKPLLPSALAKLNDNHGKLRLSEEGATNQRLLAHLQSLKARSDRVEARPAEDSVRLQDRPVEVPESSPPLRGLLRRLRAWVGI